jgi:hypothetical protein
MLLQERYPLLSKNLNLIARKAQGTEAKPYPVHNSRKKRPIHAYDSVTAAELNRCKTQGRVSVSLIVVEEDSMASGIGNPLQICGH